MKNKYIYLTLLFASINNGHAILIGDEETLKASKDMKNTSGAYESYTESFSISNRGARVSGEGNATLFKIDDDKVITISAAHCLKTLNLDVTKAIILSREKKQPSGYNLSLYALPGIKVDQRFFDKENDNRKHIYDFGMSNFLMPAYSPNGDQPVFKNGYFEGGFYDIPLQHQEEYAVKVRSFGPSFDNQLTSYSNYIYHEVNTTITYDQEGYFYKKLQSRDFYFKFTPKVDGSYDWYCDLLPRSGDVITDKGDSGSLMTTHDGKAIALVSTKNFSEFYRDNQELSSKLTKFRQEHKDKFFDATALEDFVKFINSEIAIPEMTKKLVTDTQQHIYRFTLKDNFKDLISKGCYTPLQPYASFIKMAPFMSPF